MPDEPRVTCIMPTHNRRRFVPRAVEYFLRQDYADSELLIVDDGTDPVHDLVPPDPRVRYLALPARLSLGAKRNVACEQAGGDIILHWDDDDWHAAHRVRYQVEALLERRADVVGINQILFYDCRDRSAWTYAYPPTERFWLYGNSLCYRREFWRRNRFADVNVGEDTTFIWQSSGAQMTALDDSTFHVSIMHGDNVSAREASGAYWRPYDAEMVRRILGADAGFYDAATAPAVRPPADPPPEVHSSAVRQLGMTAALDADLGWPEFVAFRDQQNLPRMRTWELPYALLSARLRETAAVLDCSINPCGFGERMARLYPHVLYRHWSPVQRGRFMLPVGVPDQAFDCVFCINTLEHLLLRQREALIADLAARLKPGGRLVLTSDYYFDSFRTAPDLLAAGLVHSDGSEVFNGFNTITTRDWIALCVSNGLRPLSDSQCDPREDDPVLFRNTAPFPHACIGGVFTSGRDDLVCPPRTVVLALLTWNTREPTADSVRAYASEAAVLARAGHKPIVCICDNGSDDGTQEMLRACERDFDAPHEFIYNDENLGSSVARNQIIAFALKASADYLLLMDGDIEAVPCSSLAMLRHMESTGRWVGCLGADSARCSSDRGSMTKCLYSVADGRVSRTALVAWTQYGMFRMKMFEDGIRFDEEGPFGRAGWGFEDNDLAFQMEVKGYGNQCFSGMIYLHRASRSSVTNLRRKGLDPTELFARRKKYLLEKWSNVPGVEGEMLDQIRRMPLLV